MTKKAEIPTKKEILKWTYRRNYIIISPHLSGMIEHIAKATFLGWHRFSWKAIWQGYDGLPFFLSAKRQYPLVKESVILEGAQEELFMLKRMMTVQTEPAGALIWKRSLLLYCTWSFFSTIRVKAKGAEWNHLGWHGNARYGWGLIREKTRFNAARFVQKREHARHKWTFL